jgi:hypothetical protein
MNQNIIERQRRGMKIIRRITLTIGLIMLTTLLYMLHDRITFINSATPSIGYIIGTKAVEKSLAKKAEEENSLKSRSHTTTYAPVIRFQTKDGEAVEFTASYAFSSPNYSYEEEIQILYLPSDPNKARVNTFSALWFPLIIFSFFTGIAIFSGIPPKAYKKSRALRLY